MKDRIFRFLKNKNNRTTILSMTIIFLAVIGQIAKAFFWTVPGFVYAMGENSIYWNCFGLIIGSINFISNYGMAEEEKVDVLEKIFGKWDLPDWLIEIKNYLFQIPVFLWQFLKAHFGSKRLFFKKVSVAAIASLLFYGMWWIEANKPTVVVSKDEVVEKPSMIDISYNSPGETIYEVKNGNLVTTYQKLTINFDESIVTAEEVGKAPKAGARLTPIVRGKWMWTSSRQLVFTPEENWKIGQKYTVDIGKEIIDLDREVSSRRHVFIMRTLDGVVGGVNFYEDPTNPKLKKLVGEISFNHPINYESLKNRIEVSVVYKKPYKEGKKTKYKDEEVKVDFDIIKEPGGLKAYVHSKKVDIKSYSGTGFIKLSKGVVSIEDAVKSESEDKSSITIPSVYEYFSFKTPKINIIDNKEGIPEHILMISSSTPVSVDVLKSHMKVLQLEKRKGLRYLDDLRTTDLTNAEEIEVTPIESQEEFPKRHSFKISARPNSKIYFELKGGIKSISGFELDRLQRYLIHSPDYKKELKIIQSGALLSRRGEKKISIMTRNVNSFKLKIGHVLPEQIHHLLSQSSGTYTNPRFDSYNFNKKNLAHFEKRDFRVTSGKKYQARYTVVDLRPYLDKYFKGLPARGLFFMEVSSKNGSNRDRRLINVTDLGIIIKKGIDQSRTVFVQSLKSGNPISNAKVQIIGINGLPLVTKTSDGNGRAQFPKLHFGQADKRPIAILVREGNDISYMKLDDYGRRVNFSGFEVGGVSNYSVKGKLLAYVFNDRGTYRPGEVVNLGFIVKDDGWVKALDGVPLEMDVQNPKGQIMRSRSMALNREGFMTEEFRLSRSAPTGTYTAKIYSIKTRRDGKKLRSFIGSGNFTVQEFLPDTMKIKLEFSQARYDGWVNPKNLTADVNLSNLYGLPAANRTIKSTLNINPYRVYFYKFKDYSFTDPSYSDKSYTESLDNLTTDEKGNATIPLNLDKYEQGTFRITLTSEGFDAAEARSVVISNTTIVSPESFMVGRKADGELNYLKKGTERKVHFIAVDPNLKPIELGDTKMQLSRYKYVTVLTRQANGTFKYESVKKSEILWKKDFKIGSKGTEYFLPTEEPGDYKLTIHDGKDRVVNTIEFGIAGKRNLSRSLDKDAELVIGLNKFDYLPGEEIEVEIKAPYEGSGLITIEREKVYSYKWFKAGTETSTHRIRVPRELEGNAYINISFLRSSDSDKIFMSPYSFGVKPFTVNSDRRKNPVEFDIPDLIKPGDELEIKYRTRQKGKIVVYAVNEGILQLSKYKTPRPLKHFFKKRSLDVNTFQILDLLLPENSILKKTFAEGGGYTLGASTNLNPFNRKLKDPVAYWSKLQDSGPEWSSVKYKVPDYFNGSLRIMAVSVNEDSIGSNGQHTNVRGDIIISPTVPTFISPGDEFLVSANITNNIQNSGENTPIEVKLEHSPNVKIIDGGVRSIKVSERKDALVQYKLKALDFLGNASVTFRASGKGKSAKYQETMSLRPSTSFHTTAWMSRIKKGTQKFNLDRKTFKELASKKLLVSSLPFGLTDGIFSYLSKYPYGCTEQLVSKAFPYIVMKRRPDSKVHQETMFNFIAGTLDMLTSRQNYRGGFGLYPGHDPERDFISLYSFHFLIEAKEEGFRVPDPLFKKAQTFVKNIADKSDHQLEKAYGIYLLTRAGVVTTAFISEWEQTLAETQKVSGYNQDLASAYIASSYALLKQDKKAISMISGIRLNEEGKRYYRYYSSLQREGGILYLLSNHFPDQARKLDPDNLERLIGIVKEGNYTSLSSSFLILGLDAYSRLFAGVEIENLKIKAHYLKDGKKTANYLDLEKIKGGEVDLDLDLSNLDVEYEGEKPLYISLSHGGFDHARKDSEVQSGVIIKKVLTDLKGNKIEKLKTGEEGIIELEITSKTCECTDVAIVDMLPGGFDLVVDNEKQGSGGLNIALEGSTLVTDYVDAREDRVILYSSISRNKKIFKYKVKAVSEGQFTIPGTFAEGMYDTTIKFVGKQFPVKVGAAN